MHAQHLRMVSYMSGIYTSYDTHVKETPHINFSFICFAICFASCFATIEYRTTPTPKHTTTIRKKR